MSTDAAAQDGRADVYLDAVADLTAKSYRPATFRIWWWMLGRWIALLGLICLVVTLSLLVAGAPPTLWISGYEVSVGALLVSVLSPVVGRLRRGSTAFTKGQFRWLAREDGLTVEGPFGTETIRWTTYKKAYRDDRFIYLYVTRARAQVILLSAVKDAEPLLGHLKRLGLLQRTPRSLFVV